MHGFEELGLGLILQNCLSGPLASTTVKDLQNIISKHNWSQAAAVNTHCLLRSC